MEAPGQPGRMYAQAVYGEAISRSDREKTFFENGMRVLKITESV